MINMGEIEREIKELESQGCTSMKNCDKLATLYIIREFCYNDKPLSLQTFARKGSTGESYSGMDGRSYGNRTGDPGESGRSNRGYNNQMFAHSKDYKEKLSKDDIAMVMDSTLDTIKDVNPTAYNAAIEMLSAMVNNRR